jgi:mono/diheme cytochrome c family protein
MRRAVLLIPALAALAACSAKTPDVAASRAAAPDVAAPGVASGAAAAPQPSVAQVGERIYGGNCVPCHQQTGQGIPGVYPSLAGSPVVLGDPRQLALWVMQGQRPASMPAGRYPTVMLQFGWMKAADAAALFTYLRSNFGNSAAPVDTAVVAEALNQ